MPALWTGFWATAALWLAAGAVRDAGWPAVAALALELTVWAAAATAATYLAPPFARPYFPRWALGQLPFDAMGLPGRWAHKALRHLARHGPPDGSGRREAHTMTGIPTVRTVHAPHRRPR